MFLISFQLSKSALVIGIGLISSAMGNAIVF